MKSLSIFIAAAALFLVFNAVHADAAGKINATGSVRVLFGKNVSIEKNIRPLYLAGDFDGDKKMDYVFAVKTKGMVRDLPATVQARNIATYKQLPPSYSLLMKDRLAISLAIILSSQKPKALLLVDSSHPTLFNQAYSDGLAMLYGEKAVTVIKDYKLKAKGVIVVIPTAAGIDTYLYWDGKKFEHYWPEEIP